MHAQTAGAYILSWGAWALERYKGWGCTVLLLSSVNVATALANVAVLPAVVLMSPGKSGLARARERPDGGSPVKVNFDIDWIDIWRTMPNFAFFDRQTNSHLAAGADLLPRPIYLSEPELLSKHKLLLKPAAAGVCCCQTLHIAGA